MAQPPTTYFVSAIANGEDWRDLCKTVLAEIEPHRASGFEPNIGFLYVTEELSEDAGAILTLMKSVTGIKAWAGCVTRGVCGTGVEYFDEPAISVMVGSLPKEAVHGFQAAAPNFKKLYTDLQSWLDLHDPVLAIVHADPRADMHPAQAIEEIETIAGAFMVGGLAAASGHSVLSDSAAACGVAGLILSQDVPVATCLSQGCIPMGPLREITRLEGLSIAALDGENPFDAFGSDMKAMTEQRLQLTADDILNMKPEALPENFKRLISGDAHVAFPVAGSDQNDFTVRNISSMDPETGKLSVMSERPEVGQKIMFVYRDDETVRADLSHTLVNLRARVLHDHGVFAPKGALYVSCVARAGVKFSGNPDGEPGGEMALIREILGDVPVAGFYANGEISNNRLYGYTGVLTLFL